MSSGIPADGPGAERNLNQHRSQENVACGRYDELGSFEDTHVTPSEAGVGVVHGA